MKRRPIPALAALALSLFLTAGVLAQSSSTYGLTWNNIGAGGGRPASASYVFESTIGQPDAGTMSGSQFTLTGGFHRRSRIGHDECLLADNLKPVSTGVGLGP